MGALNALVPMVSVASVPRSIEFYGKLDVAAYRTELRKAGIEVGEIEYPFHAPRGEFRVKDPDGYCLMATHT